MNIHHLSYYYSSKELRNSRYSVVPPVNSGGRDRGGGVLTGQVLGGGALRVAGRSPRAVTEPPQPHPQVVGILHSVVRHPVVGQEAAHL